MNELLAQATDLLAQGLHIRPFTTAKASGLPRGWLDAHTPEETDLETLRQLREGEACGLGVLVGPDAVIQREGRFFLPVVLEHEGKASGLGDWVARWDTALAEHGVARLMERLDSGWVDRSPSGGTHWYMLAEVPSADATIVRSFLDALPCRAVMLSADEGLVAPATSGEPEAKTLQTVAELLLDARAVICAPSGGSTHPTGQPYVTLEGGPASIPVVDWGELLALSDVLASLTEVPATAPTVPTDAKTALTLSLLDRTGTVEKAEALLAGAGWAVSTRHPDGEVEMTRDGHALVKVGGPHRPAGSAYAWGASFPGGTGFIRYAELVVRLGHGGDATAAATEALASGAVRIPVVALAPRERPTVWPEETSTPAMAEAIARALSEGVGPTGAPFVVSERTADGRHAGFATVTASREIRRWGAADAERLALAAVQPQRRTKIGQTLLHALPRAVVSMGLETAEEQVPPARFLASEPVLLPSGHTLSEDGWYPEHAALVAIPAREAAVWRAYSVPEVVTLDDAQAAIDLVRRELLTDFPFAGAGDEARALAYLLTVASRHLYPLAPGFLFTAPDRGSGKDLLASLGRIILTGSASYAAVSDPKETEKVLVSAQLSGQRFIHNPEIRREQDWRDDKLQEVMTSPVTQMRVLGTNSFASVAGRIVTGCGNNATISSDLVRRFLPVGLHFTGQGVAFGRTSFRHDDLPGWVAGHRGELLAALHTVLAYGLQQRVEHTAAGLGSFEAWSRVVLGALSLVTIDGTPVATLALADRAEWVEAADVEGLEWGELLEAWGRLTGDWLSASGVRAALQRMRTPEGEQPALPPALLAIDGISSRSTDMQWGSVLRSREHTRVLVDGVAYWVETQKWSGSSTKYRVCSDQSAPRSTTSMLTGIEAELAAQAVDF